MRAIFLSIFMFISSLGLSAQELTDTVETRIYFSCNSSTLTPAEESKVMAISGQIISVEGYASTEGREEANQILSANRANAVGNLLDFRPVGLGETAQFGNALASNRVVIVKSLVVRNSTTSLNVLPTDSVITTTVGTVTHPEGFFCGERRDPSSYFADTTDLVEVVDSALKVEECIDSIETTTVVDTVTTTVATVDSSYYLPVPQAIRFYMKKGMSRKEATALVQGRKDLWKPLKKSDIRKPKKVKRKRSRLPRKSRGMNDSVWSRLFPFRGC
jgi:hypothetical protein